MGALGSCKIDKKSDVPIWVQIRQRLAYCIMSGKLKTGAQLPTVRELAIELDVNYHTVNKVYRDLEKSGLVEVRAGRGSYVADLSKTRYLVLESDTHAAVAEHATKLLELGMTPEEAVCSIANYLGVSIKINSPVNEGEPETKQRGRRVG